MTSIENNFVSQFAAYTLFPDRESTTLAVFSKAVDKDVYSSTFDPKKNFDLFRASLQIEANVIEIFIQNEPLKKIITKSLTTKLESINSRLEKFVGFEELIESQKISNQTQITMKDERDNLFNNLAKVRNLLEISKQKTNALDFDLGRCNKADKEKQLELDKLRKEFNQLQLVIGKLQSESKGLSLEKQKKKEEEILKEQEKTALDLQNKQQQIELAKFLLIFENGKTELSKQRKSSQETVEKIQKTERSADDKTEKEIWEDLLSSIKTDIQEYQKLTFVFDETKNLRDKSIEWLENQEKEVQEKVKSIKEEIEEEIETPKFNERQLAFTQAWSPFWMKDTEEKKELEANLKIWEEDFTGAETMFLKNRERVKTVGDLEKPKLFTDFIQKWEALLNIRNEKLKVITTPYNIKEKDPKTDIKLSHISERFTKVLMSLFEMRYLKKKQFQHLGKIKVEEEEKDFFLNVRVNVYYLFYLDYALERIYQNLDKPDRSWLEFASWEVLIEIEKKLKSEKILLKKEYGNIFDWE